MTFLTEFSAVFASANEARSATRPSRAARGAHDRLTIFWPGRAKIGPREANPLLYGAAELGPRTELESHAFFE
jgi:hypothetical protein